MGKMGVMGAKFGAKMGKKAAQSEAGRAAGRAAVKGAANEMSDRYDEFKLLSYRYIFVFFV